MEQLPELLTPQEAKQYFHCNDRTIYNLCRRKDFPSFRIGKRYFINKDELIEWMKKETKKNKNFL